MLGEGGVTVRMLGLMVLALVACDAKDAPPPPPVPDTPDAPGPLPHLVHRLSAGELRRTAAQVLGVDVPTDGWLPPVSALRGFEQLDEAVVDLPAWVDALEGWSRAVVQARREVVVTAPAAITLRGADLPWDGGELAVVRPWSFTVVQTTVAPISAVLEVPTSGRWTLLLSWMRASLGEADAVLTLDGVEVARFDGPLLGQERRSDTVSLDLEAGEHVVNLVPGFVRDEPLAPLEAPAWLVDRGPWVGVDQVVLTLQVPSTASPALPPLLACAPQQEPTCVRDTLRELVAGLWRRPAEEEELDELVAVVDAALAQGATLDQGVDDAVVAMMLSPDFAFLVEREDQPAWALASRLAFALWEQGPDEALRRCAASGALLGDGDCGVAAQVQRMLADPRSDVLVTEFAERWLGVADLERMGFVIHQQPWWSPALVHDLLAELDDRLRSARAEGADLRSILTSTTSVGTGRVEQHYGLPVGSITRPHPFDLAPTGRVGLLGMAAVEMAWAKGTAPSVVDPAVWLLPRLLCRAPPPPPPNVPLLAPDQDPLTEMDVHLRDPSCAACHASIDPYGAPLTVFDAIGRARPSPSSSSTLPEGVTVNDLHAYGAWLAASPEVAACITRHVAIWAWRRNVRNEDASALAQVQAEALAGGFTLDALFAAALKVAP